MRRRDLAFPLNRKDIYRAVLGLIAPVSGGKVKISINIKEIQEKHHFLVNYYREAIRLARQDITSRM